MSHEVIMQRRAQLCIRRTQVATHICFLFVSHLYNCAADFVCYRHNRLDWTVRGSLFRMGQPGERYLCFGSCTHREHMRTRGTIKRHVGPQLMAKFHTKKKIEAL